MRAARSLAGGISFLFFLFGLLAVALLLLPRLLSFTPCVVLSGSMSPVYEAGDLVYVDSSRREPQTGDIVAYDAGGTIVTHRVIKKTKEGYITKGDANKTEDFSPVLKNQVVGIVVGHIPRLGYFVEFLSSGGGVFLIAALAVLSCAALCVRT